MPELPEVETILRGLNKNILGTKITRVQILEPKIVGFLNTAFKRQVEGKTIKAIKRRAKLLIFALSSDVYLLFHLKISGQLIIHGKNDKLDKFTRVIFYLSGGQKLFFNDLRKFGYIKIFDKAGLEKQLSLLNFGPEPLGKEFSLEIFAEILKRRKTTPIKPLLMEPKLIAGIGNIYASEVCFLAGIRPNRSAGSLSQKETKKLHTAIIDILKLSIKLRGTSTDDYLDAFGRKGSFEEKLKVYGRTGMKCPKCSGTVARISQRGRGTFYCPNCQK